MAAVLRADCHLETKEEVRKPARSLLQLDRPVMIMAWTSVVTVGR